MSYKYFLPVYDFITHFLIMSLDWLKFLTLMVSSGNRPISSECKHWLFKFYGDSFLRRIVPSQKKPSHLEVTGTPCPFLKWLRQMTSCYGGRQGLSLDLHLGQHWGSIVSWSFLWDEAETGLALTPLLCWPSFSVLFYFPCFLTNISCKHSLNQWLTQESPFQSLPLRDSISDTNL